MTRYVTVTPAHGRDYKSAKAAKADFNANKDFILQDWWLLWDTVGVTYAGRDDLIHSGNYDVVNIRYKRNAMVTSVTLGA
tara:strand:+ start:1825 stop:2064 length:240 start_codon:yes stop_codon:yes gene_type:complete